MCSPVWPCPQTHALLERSCSCRWCSGQRGQQVWSQRAVSVSPDAVVPWFVNLWESRARSTNTTTGTCWASANGGSQVPPRSQHYKVRWSRQDLTGLSCSVTFGEPCLPFKKLLREFSGDPVVRTLCSQHWEPGFSPWSKIPQALLLSQKKKNSIETHCKIFFTQCRIWAS